MFSAVARATLLFPSGPANDVHRNHLFVLLNDPFGPAQQVLMVSVCSATETRHDRTCILTPDDHDFIRHESYVAYSKLRIEAANSLVAGVAKGFLIDKGAIRQDVFERILNGLRKSPFTRPFAMHFLDQVAAEIKRAGR